MIASTEQQWEAILDEHRERASRAVAEVCTNPSHDELCAVMNGSMAEEILTLRNALMVARVSNQLSGRAYTVVCNAMEGK